MTDAASPIPAASSGAAGPKVRNPWGVIGLSIITCGIYFLFWTYFVYTEMKEETGEGIGGPIGVLIGVVIGIVNGFLIPAEAGSMYAKAGREKPVTGLTGLWLLLPIVGLFVWTIKVQGALNTYWESR